MRAARLAVVLAVVLALAAACHGGNTEHTYRPATGGDPERGAAVIAAAGCGGCHTIPGIRGAVGVVGPPLTMFARRTYIAGQLPNTPENLARWIHDPQLVEHGTAMPNLKLTSQQARDAAAYLYTLR